MLLETLLLAPFALQAGLQGDGFGGTTLNREPRVEIHWNRFYDDAELYEHFDRLQAAWPELVKSEVIGHSVENRELRVYTLNNPSTGVPKSKPAMWVDANVHGNEVQGSEVTLYLAWYLLENYEHNPRVTELLDGSVFYILPMVNPDGRHHWIHGAHSAHSSRTGYQPTDNDRDGQADEDGPDDLDGDGNITQMRKYVPRQGTHRLDPDDPRILIPVPENDEGRRGDWLLLGSEGIDNDGDGRINEDGKGGYDMNRAWPSFWRAGHVQYGAGPYPLHWPETRCVANFLYEHENVAAIQSFHNNGGMILRGPGTETFGEYAWPDLAVFNELGEDGEKMLPFYRYMILWKDLYSVFGGFATWGYEGLGAISFTNELWTSKRNFPDRSRADSRSWDERRKDRHWFDDNLLLGSGYVEWKQVEHPLYGEIEVGGFKKDVGRVPPSFLVEEMLHRNALFCIKHALAMPDVTIEDVELTELGEGVTVIDATFRNLHLIPTRTARAAEVHIGRPDRFTIEGANLEVLAGGFRTDRWRSTAIELAEHEPERLVRNRGIGSRDVVRVRWFVRGAGKAILTFQADKAMDVGIQVELP